jgi:hypothetical protein
MPDAGKKSAIIGVLLLPVGDGAFHRHSRLNEIDPRVPFPDMLPIGRDNLEDFFRVLAVNQS